MEIKRLKDGQFYVLIIDEVVGRVIIKIGTAYIQRWSGKKDIWVDYDRSQVPFGKKVDYFDSIVECRRDLKMRYRDAELVHEGKDIEIYALKKRKAIPIKNAALIHRRDNYFYFSCSNYYGESDTLGINDIEWIKYCLKYKLVNFVDLEINNQGEIVQKRVDYSQYRDWLDTDDGYKEMWTYIERMKNFSDKQKAYIKNYILTKDYGIDNEDLISIMTDAEIWFPHKFRSLDTACRDKAFDLLIRFKVMNADNSQYVNRDNSILMNPYIYY